MRRGPSVLVVDDDPAVRRLLRRELMETGYRVRESEPNAEALRLIGEQQFDLIILDIDSLPGGIRGLRDARTLTSAPILTLSSRNDEDAAAEALDNGADDYVTKPFRTKEVLARLQNALRHAARQRGKQAEIRTEDLEIDLVRRRVRVRGHDVHLPAKPYEVLRVLAENAGKVLRHDEILHAVWGDRSSGRTQYLRVAIRDLRRKLEADPAHPRRIVTVTRVGYRLDTAERAGKAAGVGPLAPASRVPF